MASMNSNSTLPCEAIRVRVRFKVGVRVRKSLEAGVLMLSSVGLVLVDVVVERWSRHRSCIEAAGLSTERRAR